MDTRYRSEKIGSLVGALSKAQGTYKPLIPNQDGPRGKYANLDATLSSTRESLSKNGICFTQHEEIVDGSVLLVSTIAHESDEYMCSIARVVKRTNDRLTASIVDNYKRRHAQQLLGIAPTLNDPMNMDDDFEEVSEQLLIQEIRKPDSDKKVPGDIENVINKTQFQELVIELEGYKEIYNDILRVHGIESLADLPQSEYHKAQKKIRSLKRIEEEYERGR